MIKKIIIFGSNSFSGAHFIDLALSFGMEVYGFSRSLEPNNVFLPYKTNIKKNNFHFYQVDLNNDIEKIMEIINDWQPECIVNFAAQGMVAESWLHPEHWFHTNVLSNVIFHDRLRKCQFLKKYIHISTPEVYGSCNGTIGENTTYNPSTPYAVSRAACDMSLLSFFKRYKFPVVFTRSANVYGPGQQLYRIIPKTILCIKNGMKLHLHGGGHSVRSFIHIRDVVDGTLKVVQKSPAGEIYHFSTDRLISIRALVEMICKKMGVQFDDVVEVVGERPGKDAAYLLDSTKAKSKLNWQDNITLEQGIDETISWVNDNLNEIKNQKSKYVHKP